MGRIQLSVKLASVSKIQGPHLFLGLVKVMGALCGSHEACPVWIIAEEKVCTNSTNFNVYTHFH